MRTPTWMLAVVALGAWAAVDARAAEPARPNILFIFADDHAAHALSCYSSKVNETPHLDRLAAGGHRPLAVETASCGASVPLAIAPVGDRDGRPT